ncbi:MAG: hypothetical protein NTY74_12145 [Ignavibacteriae bacterium]|nr:hypothetical protein [Ignavibacteriota bacterium]
MKKDDYHVQIKPEFLFDDYDVFKSGYTPWLYVSIKLKYNYNLDKAPYKTFTVDVNTMADYYATTPVTIYEALKELETTGLLIKKKRKYQLVDESVYLTKFRKVDIEEATKYPDFIQLYRDDYKDLLLQIKRVILPTGKNKRLIIKCLKVFYYLMARNRHCLLIKEPLLESSLTQTSLVKLLGGDHKVLKVLLSVLNNTGYIKVKPGKIFTINKEIFDPEKHWFTKPEVCLPVETKPIIQPPLTSQSETEKVPDYFIGFGKCRDGKDISIIYYSKKYKSIMTKRWCAGDGVPQTPEEFDILNNLMNYGKESRHYNPESFWDYKKAA